MYICLFCQTHHHKLKSTHQWLSKGSSCQKQSTSQTPSKVVGAGSMTAKVPTATTANPFSAVMIFSFQWKPCCTWTLWTAFFTGCDVETERAIGRKNNMMRSGWLGRRAPDEEDSEESQLMGAVVLWNCFDGSIGDGTTSMRWEPRCQNGLIWQKLPFRLHNVGRYLSLSERERYWRYGSR